MKKTIMSDGFVGPMAVLSTFSTFTVAALLCTALLAETAEQPPKEEQPTGVELNVLEP